MSSQNNIKLELLEDSATTFKVNPLVKCDETSNKILAILSEENTSTVPKKRGRKKKSEITVATDNTINEDATSSRSSRGKKVDYCAMLSHNGDSDEERISQKRRKIRNNNLQESSNVSTPNQTNKRQRGVVTDEMMSKIFTCMNSSTSSVVTFDNLIQIPEEEIPSQPPPPQKCKRGRKTKKQRRQENDDSNNVEETVTCGRCNLSMEGKDWKNHKRNFHNDLAWKLGETPIDLNDRALVTSILGKVYKAHRPLNCENCGTKKKSVLGFLSHKMQCEKSAEEIGDIKVKCELCGNTMLPVSMAVHMRLSHGSKLQETSDLIMAKSTRKSAAKAQKMIQLVANDSDELQLSTRSFITKKSNFLTSIQAKQKLTKELEMHGHIKCKFVLCSILMESVSEAIQHMLKHYSSKTTNNSFGCRACLSIFNSKGTIQDHVLKEHLQNNDKNDDTFEVSSDASDEDEIVDSKITRKLTREPRFLMKSRVSKSEKVVYPLAYLWTAQLYKNNYNIPNLFENFLPYVKSWQQISEDLIEKYSPQFSHSMDIALKRTNSFINANSFNYEWKKMELFESVLFHLGATIFCGGLITSMSWVPTPHDENVEQILAVSIALDFNKKYHVNELSTDAAMIQFWNLGLLDNHSVMENVPQLEFCLCGDFGYVTHMEWCPSGCYDIDVEWEDSERLQRLGLLAVASSDSYVYVFSVPKPFQLKAKLIKPSPILKLQIQSETEQKLTKTTYIPTRVSWTKACEHRYIAVGYSNGLVALFDLKTNSCLLKSQEILQPIKIFQAHLHSITALSLYHTSGGCRWLLTASLDRHLKFWDLTNTSTHIAVYKKVPITDGVWLTHWTSAVFGFDEDGTGCNPSVVYPARDFLSETRSILYSSSTVTAIAGSDWLNSIIQGNSSGEVIGLFPHQLMVALDNDRSLPNKKVLLSYARVVEKNLSANDRLKKESEKNSRQEKVNSEENSDSDSEEVVQKLKTDTLTHEPLDYEGIEKKYGVVFCDTDMIWGSKEDVQKIGYQSSYLLPEQTDAYAATKVNRLSFNPNKQSHVYFATGYQIGFVRIASLKNIKEKA